MTKEKRSVWRKNNPEKHKAEQRLHYGKHKEEERLRSREFHLKRNGWSIAKVEEARIKQGNACAICRMHTIDPRHLGSPSASRRQGPPRPRFLFCRSALIRRRLIGWTTRFRDTTRKTGRSLRCGTQRPPKTERGSGCGGQKDRRSMRLGMRQSHLARKRRNLPTQRHRQSFRLGACPTGRSAPKLSTC